MITDLLVYIFPFLIMAVRNSALSHISQTSHKTFCLQMHYKLTPVVVMYDVDHHIPLQMLTTAN